MEERKPRLEIIVPHYKEPWRTGEKLFAMLALQRGIDPGAVRVTVVQDGPEGGEALPERLTGTLRERVIAIPHGGVSAARNAGIEAAEGDWLCFCDFDDMFTSVFSLKVALGALDRADRRGAVYVWNRFNEEARAPDGQYFLYRHDWDMTFIHGRFIRRDFLADNGIRFNPRLTFGEDQDFNTICQVIAGEDRIEELKEPIYLWCENPESVTRRETDKTVFYPKMLEHRFATLEELRVRGYDEEYTAGVVRTVLNCYYEMTGPDVRPKIRDSVPLFAAWWRRHRTDWMAAPPEMISDIMATVRRIAVEKRGVVVEDVTLGAWLTEMDGTE